MEQTIRVCTFCLISLQFAVFKIGFQMSVITIFAGKTERMNAYSSTCGVKGGKNKSKVLSISLAFGILEFLAVQQALHLVITQNCTHTVSILFPRGRI